MAFRTARNGLRRVTGLGLAIIVGMSAAGCASRTVVEEQPIAAAQPRPSEPINQQSRQGVGAPPAVWMDDPAKRRGPQGQPAPFGRDTVTGRPLSDLPPEGTPPPPARFAPPAARTAGAPAPAGNTVVVQRGETLFAIARRHNVTVDALKRANTLSTDGIREGQTLVVPVR